METLAYAIVVFIAIMAIGTLSEHQETARYREGLPPNLPQLGELSRDQIEALWVDNKRRIFHNTCTPSKHSNSYGKLLLMQNRQLENKLLSIHISMYATSAYTEEAKNLCSRAVGSNKLNLRGNIDLNSLQPDLILSLAFLAYSESPLDHSDFIENTPNEIIEYVNHVLTENYPLAQLLKGIILKYGFYPTQRPFSREAKKWLSLASINGIPEADIELKNIHAHHVLDDLRDGFNDAYRKKWQ